MYINLTNLINNLFSIVVYAISILKTNFKKKNIIRKKRKECFAIINRGNAWYNTLSSIQKTELDAWYQEWLSATDTLNLPIKPDWLV